MSYKHKWVNDKSRYAVIYSCGRVVEYSCEPSAKVASRCEVGAKYIQRYTDQQMELETQGWTPWNAGDEKPNVDDHLMIDIFDNDDHETKTVCEEFGDFSWESNMNAIAYRLSNADGYKDGVKVKENMTACCGNCSHEWRILDVNLDSEPCPKCGEAPEAYYDQILLSESAIKTLERMQYEFKGGELWKPPIGPIPDFILNDKPEWKAGELPPANFECEFDHHTFGWTACFTIGKFADSMVCAPNGGGFYAGTVEQFRPIQTEKERVIEKAIEIYLRDSDDKTCARITANHLYDADLLSMPDKGEE